MADPRTTHTNAADSAPGVDDGRARGHGPPINSKPGGRPVAWVIAAIFVILVLLAFLMGHRSQPNVPSTPGGDATGQAPATQSSNP